MIDRLFASNAPSEEEKDEDQEEAGDDMKLSWTTLDMSSINDPEQLTGSSRVYANAKPGIIMEAFFMSGESNLVFIINELDKANAGKGNGNPADVLLTLLDNLGFTDNYMECLVTPEGLDAVIAKYADTTGIRDLEQAAEHIAANALYQIEVNGVKAVRFDGQMVRELLG